MSDVPFQPNRAPGLPEQVTRHSLAWLLAGNLVGLLMAALLLWPEGGRLLGHLTYGRWATVHLNVQLYGWCSVPLLGLLFRLYLPAGKTRGGALALNLWSGALAFSVVAWLSGEVSGKPFMEWRGPTRWVMPAAMIALAATLALGYALRLRNAPEARAWRSAKWILLLVLGAVPFVLAWAADPALYPVINPDSGGATGGSLLGSTLGIIVMFLAFPLIVGLPLKKRSRWLVACWLALAAHYGWFFALDHGHRSHHELSQIIALFSLVLWWPLLVRYLAHFTWPAGSRRWLLAFAAWGAILLITALFTFLPGVLDRWKFTNALVAHTHIAMAGMLSCFLMLILIALDDHAPRRAALAEPLGFALWHGGALLMCGALLALGTLEADQPARVYFSEPISQTMYLLRLLAGVAMTLAVLRWWRGLNQPNRESDT
jgi:cytochrome c oxidase cbb3-type subunit 1